MVRIILVAVLMLAGCAEAPVPTVPIKLSGTITGPEDLSGGKVRVNLYHAWSLEGALRHPLAEIESFEASLGDYSHEFDYPTEKGEGLVVYAWLDTDGDDVLCTPTVRTDLAGLTEAQGFPADTVTVNVELTRACAGPDWFFPPAP